MSLISARRQCALCGSSVARASPLLVAARRPIQPVTFAASFTSSSARSSSNDADLLQQIKGNLKEAMKSKDSSTTAVLRGLLSEFQYAEKQVQGGSGKAPSLISILQKAVSKRHEAASQYRSAKPQPREDLAAKEEEQVELIKRYLPKEMERSEIVEIAKQVVKELGIVDMASKGALGKVMGEMSKRVDKAKAPGQVISAVVKELLGGK